MKSHLFNEIGFCLDCGISSLNSDGSSCLSRNMREGVDVVAVLRFRRFLRLANYCDEMLVALIKELQDQRETLRLNKVWAASLNLDGQESSG